MVRSKRTLTAVVLLISLTAAACGSSGDPGGGHQSQTPPTSLAEACPRIEQALISDASHGSKDWALVLKTLRDLRQSADVEAANAIDLLSPVVEEMAQDPADQAARAQFRATVNTLSKRCRAAGSTAFM